MQSTYASERAQKTHQQFGDGQQAINSSSKLDAVLLVLSAVQLALFVPLAWWVHNHPVDAPDLAITRAFQKQKSDFLRYAMLTISYIGGTPKFLRVIVVPVALILWKRHLRLAAIMTLALSWTTEFMKSKIKHIVKRPRPSPALVHVYISGHGESFPSGNVVAAITFWGWLCALGMFLLQGKHSRQKIFLSIPALFVVLMGPSRVYLGDHWTTDVLGGYLFGGTSLSLALEVYLILRRKGILSKG